jgi:2-keto-3-deoxy-L-rhamnonate aldolase RhmA
MSGPSGFGPSGFGPSGFADDAVVVRALAGAVALADPVPAEWHLAARVGFDWLAIDARLAGLEVDSLDEHRPAGTAHVEGSERRRLRFGAAGLAIEVEVTVTNGSVRLAGRLVPAGTPGAGRSDAGPSGGGHRARAVRALQPQAAQVARVGEGGTFRFNDLSDAPVSLLVDGDPAVKTGWIVP